MSATDEIFKAITTQLEEGVVPWHKPWVARPSMIINITTKENSYEQQ